MNPEPRITRASLLLGVIPMLGIRLLAILVLVPASYYLIVCLPFSLLPATENLTIPISVSLIWAVVVVWCVYWKRKLGPQGFIANALMGGVLGGSIGLSLGFLGPIFLLPVPDIAPLIGLVIVAPILLVLGAIGGLLHRFLAKS